MTVCRTPASDAPATDVAPAASTPTVGVVIPCYGQARLLPQAVASVAAQTRRPIQCVIVDDGCPGETGEVAGQLQRRYGSSDLAITVVRQENGGLAAARNAGIAAGDADWWIPLDADDVLLPRAVEHFLDTADRHPKAAVLMSNGWTFGDVEQRLRSKAVSIGRLRRQNCVLGCSAIRRDVWEQVSGYDASMRDGYEDWDFWLRVVQAGGTFAAVDRDTFLYRRHGVTMLGEADRRALLLRSRILVNHPGLFAGWRVAVARRMLAATDHGGRPGVWVRLGSLISLVLDGRVGLALRQVRMGLGAAGA